MRTPLGSIRDEFTDADIPDWRLRERLLTIAADIDEAPSASLPVAVKTPAAREAAYRFLGNARVTIDRIIAPHIRATAERCREGGTVYVVSDSTECSFAGEDRGERLGRLQGDSRGFLAHVALAVSGTGVPLGVLGLEPIVRPTQKKTHKNIYQRKKDPTRESLRWAAMVERASEALEGHSAIHVMDSEADIFELLTDLSSKSRRFIIRSCQPRLVEGGSLAEALEHGKVLLTREVSLSRRLNTGAKRFSRRNPPRPGRQATLEISASQVSLRRPKTCTTEYPAFLPVNVVRVVETAPPDGERPVEWVLFTSERVDTELSVAAVVDGYRRRWIIEEYFKALKTGCSYEQRELESLRTLTNFLGIAAVIAWRLLALRALHREDSTQPATAIVDSDLLEALAARLKELRIKKPFPALATVADLMTGIATLGGHITSNGPPGWQVLWRGYQHLLSWSSGYLQGKSITYSDQS